MSFMLGIFFISSCDLTMIVIIISLTRTCAPFFSGSSALTLTLTRWSEKYFYFGMKSALDAGNLNLSTLLEF
jgi:hypothetical protein